MKRYIIILITNAVIIILNKIISIDNYCIIPNNCQVISVFNDHIKPKNYKAISCTVNNESSIEFESSINTTNEDDEKCKSLRGNYVDIYFKRPIFNPSRLHKNDLDIEKLNAFILNEDLIFGIIVFDRFRGFDIDLFNSSSKITNHSKPTKISMIICLECDFDFYKRDQRIESCDDMIELDGSIFQALSLIHANITTLSLSKFKNRICPLAFKNFHSPHLTIEGYNSFISRRTLTFTNDTNFRNLNSKIEFLDVSLTNAKIDFTFLNPSVFETLKRLGLNSKVDFIHSDLFITLTMLNEISLNMEYFRSLISIGGIKWMRNINKDLNVNINNDDDLKANINKTKYIYLSCSEDGADPHLSDIFPEEDFCLYRDFPFSQLVFFIHSCQVEIISKTKMTCTFLHLIQYYDRFLNFSNKIDNDEVVEKMKFLVNSEGFKSISKCNFTKNLIFCNRSEFQFETISSVFDIGEIFQMIAGIIYILLYLVYICGIVANILVVITISSKQNKAEFDGLKQYDYLRIHSITNCLLLSFSLPAFLTRCEFPYQLYCPEIRKLLFVQYYDIIFLCVVFYSLQFISHFIYIAFAFNRISLIGKDHNKLVRFMCDVGIKKYITVSLFISVGLSAVKFFSFRINYGEPLFDYPIYYDFATLSQHDANLAYDIINFISDLLNYFVFLFVHLFIDIGMVIKLRETLREKMEKIKLMCSKNEQEKKVNENETVLNSAILMVILNAFLNFVCKLPSCLFPAIMLVNRIYRIGDENLDMDNHYAFKRLFLRYLKDESILYMLYWLSFFLYSFSLSIPIFFYKHFDKKFKISFERVFSFKK